MTILSSDRNEPYVFIMFIMLLFIYLFFILLLFIIPYVFTQHSLYASVNCFLFLPPVSSVLFSVLADSAKVWHLEFYVWR